jgi:hypothetical protein
MLQSDSHAKNSLFSAKAPESSSRGAARHFSILVLLSVAALAPAFVLIVPRDALSLPSYARQTGRPCSACHVGAYGPQLKPDGRDFKLYGFARGNNDNSLPLAVTALGSVFDHTDADQGHETGRSIFASDNHNGNSALEHADLFYAGRIAPNTGGLIEGSYDGVLDRFRWGHVDVRYADLGSLFSEHLAYGVTVNNQPSLSDLWNSTPAWGFPYTKSRYLPTPNATTLIDNGLQAKVLGGGLYSMWNDLLYLEFDGYQPLSRRAIDDLGVVNTNKNTSAGMIPYWRLALQHEFGNQYVQFGTYGMVSDMYASGNTAIGDVNRRVDTALDANYQWLGGRDEHFISAHATLIKESLDLAASHELIGSKAFDELNTFRTDVSYGYLDTYIPSVQYFNTWGTNDIKFWQTPNGSPNSAGYTFEIAYVPFGKEDSVVRYTNLRFTLQYTAFTTFNGGATHASNNNFLMLTAAFAGVPW